jgi:maltokinase
MHSELQLAPDGATTRLVTALAGGGEPPGCTVRRFRDLPPLLRDVERRITIDRTNTSVVVDEQVVVKWLRPGATSRAPDLLAHLLASGFTGMPTPYAAVYRDGEPVAMVTAFLPDAVGGWEWCVADLLDWLDGGPAAGFAQAIGTLAAQLHAALATPSVVLPAPVTAVTVPAGDFDALREARALTLLADATDGRWLADRATALANDIDRPARHSATAIQIHGDLHVGQLLRWRDGLAVIHFDGDPTAATADGWQPAARDLAQLCTSVLHVAQIANRRSDGRHRQRLLDWAEESADELLRAYRAELAARGLSALLDERLLRPFEVEQECRELIYAAKFLPRWRYAPMGVLRSWYA